MLYNNLCNLINIYSVQDRKEELMPWQTIKLMKSRGDTDQSIPDPSESSVHGKEIHVAKQQQTQKEVSYNEFIHCGILIDVTIYLFLDTW